MLLYRNAGLVPAGPATGAAVLRVALVVLLLGAVALRRLDWWKLVDHAPRLIDTGHHAYLHAAALGVTVAGADDAEELACDGQRDPDALRHAAFRVILEAAALCGLLAAARACGLSGGWGDGESDAIAYLADAFAAGWGESIAAAGAVAVYAAACGAMRSDRVAGTRTIAMTRATLDPPRRSEVAPVIATNTA